MYVRSQALDSREVYTGPYLCDSINQFRHYTFGLFLCCEFQSYIPYLMRLKLD